MSAPPPLRTGGWSGCSFVSIDQLDLDGVLHVCDLAGRMRALVESTGGSLALQHRVLANVFYEPSTRTSSSFAAAMQRLGGTVLQISESSSSAVKGETLSDSIRSLSCYADVVVLRHPLVGSAAVAARASRVPVLNAGDGVGEHPTQALLDLFTILAERRAARSAEALAGVTVVMLGDLKHGRTTHSLLRVLALFGGVTLRFVSPPELRMPGELLVLLSAAGIAHSCHESLAELTPAGASVLASADVLYVTRVQKERFADAAQYERLRLAYVITPELLRSGAKESLVIMHPLPRVGEIDEAVDADPRAAYFRQMRNGMFVRMALLALVCGVEV